MKPTARDYRKLIMLAGAVWPKRFPSDRVERPIVLCDNFHLTALRVGGRRLRARFGDGMGNWADGECDYENCIWKWTAVDFTEAL